MPQAIRFALALILLVLGAYAQYAHVMQIGEVNPNIVMVLTIVYMFFLGSTALVSVIILVAALLVKWEPGLSYELVGFVGVLFLAWALKKNVRWQPSVGVSVLVIGATALLVLILDPYFFIAHPGIILGEMVYNVALGNLLVIVGSQAGNRRYSSR